MPQSWAFEKGLNNKQPKYNNPIHISFEASEVTRLEQGLWLTPALSFFTQKFIAEGHLQHPLTFFSQDSHSNHKMKKQKSWGTGFSNKDGKKDFQGSWGSSSEKVKDTLKILTTVIKICFALFCSNIASMRIPFSLL